MSHPVARGCAVLLALSVGAAASPAFSLTELEALQAVDRFMVGWNSRDPMVFARTLHYPHVRPTARGGGRVFTAAHEYAAPIDFAQVVATGWDRSRFDSTRVVHLGSDKAHVAGRYTRWRADGTPIYTTQITYVVTQRGGSIAVQARFAAGLDDLTPAERAANASAAVAVVDEYLRAFNARDEDAWVATFNFPHVRLAGDTVTVWETGAEYAAAFDFAAFAERLGWDHTTWDSVEAIQVARDTVNVAISATRWGPGDVELHSFDTLYRVTLQDGHWGIRARSSFAP